MDHEKWGSGGTLFRPRLFPEAMPSQESRRNPYEEEAVKTMVLAWAVPLVLFIIGAVCNIAKENRLSRRDESTVDAMFRNKSK